jgi:hypothetical protein
MKTIFNTFHSRLPVLGLAGVLALAGSALAFTEVSKGKAQSPSIKVPVDETAVPRDGLPRGSFAPIVQKVVPGVVKIEMSGNVQNAAMESPPGFDDPF